MDVPNFKTPEEAIAWVKANGGDVKAYKDFVGSHTLSARQAAFLATAKPTR